MCSISLREIEIKDFSEDNTFSIRGFKTFFPPKRNGSATKRLICLVREDLEVIQRDDLMSEWVSSVWLELKGGNQKVLINVVYREWSDLANEGQFNSDQQVERWQIFLAKPRKQPKKE